MMSFLGIEVYEENLAFPLPNTLVVSKLFWKKICKPCCLTTTQLCYYNVKMAAIGRQYVS